MNQHFELLCSPATRSVLAGLVRIITLGDGPCLEQTALNEDYESFLSSAPCTPESDTLYDTAIGSVQASDVASLQFTSGKHNPTRSSPIQRSTLISD